MPISPRLLFFLIPLVHLALEAPAAVLLSFNFTGANDNVSNVAANLSSSHLTIGAVGDEFGIVGNSATGNGWSAGAVTNDPGAAAAPETRFIRSQNLIGTEGGAVANDDFFEFTVTMGGGFTASLTDIGFDIASTGGGIGVTNDANWFVRSSADAFGATVGSVVEVTQTGNTTSSYRHFSFDLSAPTFQDLTGEITFRLYTFAQTSNPNSLNRIDNIVLNGSVAPVPEPAALVLLGLGFGAVVLKRRQRGRC